MAYLASSDRGDAANPVADISAERLLVENERLKAQLKEQMSELSESRVRLIDAADAERIRLERNLHDGAQQQLLAISLKLRLARKRAGDHQADVSGLLDEAIADLEQSSNELRRIARGAHPAILSDRGLSAAIEALADRTPMAFMLAELPQERMPKQVELTAYFVVAEAVTNVMRYANANLICVRVIAEGSKVIVEVSDDGDGGADPACGSGLRGLADRVKILEGSLGITSHLGEGTTVTAMLKWPRPALTAIPFAERKSRWSDGVHARAAQG